MVEDAIPAADNSVSVQQLLEDDLPLPLISPFVSGTPCLTPEGETGHLVSDALILEAPADQGGRKYIASYWEEARLHARRGARVSPESTVRVRVQGRIRRIPANELRILVRRDLASLDED